MPVGQGDVCYSTKVRQLNRVGGSLVLGSNSKGEGGSKELHVDDDVVRCVLPFWIDFMLQSRQLHSAGVVMWGELCEEKATKAGDIKKKHVHGRHGVVVHAAWAFGSPISQQKIS